MSMPTVSVCIPCYNSAVYIAEAIDSVMNQTIADIEILVVDDGSTDNTEQIITNISCSDRRVHYFKLEHKNANVGRNYAVAQSRGKYIAFLDSDDIWLPNHLESCLYAIKLQNADGVYGSIILNGKIATVRSLLDNESVIDYLLSTGYGAQTSTLFLTGESARVVLWDEDIYRHQDYDFVIRYAKKYKLAPCQEATVIYRTSKRPSYSIDFRSCIKVIERNRKDISRSVFLNYAYHMLGLAWRLNAEKEIIQYYTTTIHQIY